MRGARRTGSMRGLRAQTVNMGRAACDKSIRAVPRGAGRFSGARSNVGTRGLACRQAAERQGSIDPHIIEEVFGNCGGGMEDFALKMLEKPTARIASSEVATAASAAINEPSGRSWCREAALGTDVCMGRSLCGPFGSKFELRT